MGRKSVDSKGFLRGREWPCDLFRSEASRQLRFMQVCWLHGGSVRVLEPAAFGVSFLRNEAHSRHQRRRRERPARAAVCAKVSTAAAQPYASAFAHIDVGEQILVWRAAVMIERQIDATPI